MSSSISDQSNTSPTSDSDSDYNPDPESIENKLKNYQSDIISKKKNQGCKIKGCDGSGNIRNVNNIIKFKKHYKEKFCPLKYIFLFEYFFKTNIKFNNLNK